MRREFWHRTLRAWWRRHHPGAQLAEVQWIYSDRYRFEDHLLSADLCRGQRILTHLDRLKLIDPGELHQPRRASMRKLLLVHTEDYLNTLQDRAVVSRILGAEVDTATADRVVLAQRCMVGGTLVATRYALDRGWTMVNLGGGLHHAGPAKGEGFCLFHDLAIAIVHQRGRGFDAPILVIDLDLHDGDGTREIFREDPSVLTLSIHNRDLGHADAVADVSVALGSEVEDSTYLEVVRREVGRALESHRPELVFFLAGTDVAADDKLGDWQISESAIFERDRWVIDAVRSRGIPLVITLAGGYGQQAWRYSARTLAWLRAGREMPDPPATDDLPLATYRHLSRYLSVPAPSARQEKSTEAGGFDLDLSVTDLPGMSRDPADRRFLGRYTVHGVELALEKAGVLERIRKHGYPSIHVESDVSTTTGSTMRIVSTQPERVVLVELRARRDGQTIPGLELLYVDWLLSQNPKGEFLLHRPELPGQSYPGLGLLRDIASLLWVSCETFDLDGIAFVPSHVALAVQSRNFGRFVDADLQAQFEGALAATRNLSTVERLRALHEGRVVRSEDGATYRYQPSLMLAAVSDRAKEHLAASAPEVEVPRYHLVSDSP